MTRHFPMEVPTWDLDPIFEGGVDSEEFSTEVDSLQESLESLHDELKTLKVPDEVPFDEAVWSRWDQFLSRYFAVVDRFGEASSFSRAVASAHADEAKAVRMPARLDDAKTALEELKVDLRELFRGAPPQVLEAFWDDERMSSRRLWLEELCRDANRAMDRDLEALAVELNRDGIQAWSRLYSQVSGRLEVEVEIDGERKALSVAQAKNFMSDSRRKVRKEAFDGLQSTWGEVAPVCASILHSIRGTEQTLFERRGGDYLTKPLQVNRVERQSVEAMFEAARECKPLLVRYLKAKARLLGQDRLQWYDLDAPVGDDDAQITYPQAHKFLVEQVERFSPKIARFCRKAMSRRWVEADDRAGKRQGGYCTSFPVTGEIRIFMTFGDTNSSMTTLAHELGHGYHSEVINDLEYSQRRLPMGLAETASTLLEAIVEQAALEDASETQRLSLVDDRLGRAVTFLMNIPARFELEEAMHEKRAQTTLHQTMLSEMTTEIFQRHYGEGVEGVDELYWASKLHFYLARMPFYNFPYTFGYLFSRAVYQRARKEGSDFVDRLDDLLRDTGRMRSEEIARNYLDADLGDPTFWKEAVGDLDEDVRWFENAVASKAG